LSVRRAPDVGYVVVVVVVIVAKSFTIYLFNIARLTKYGNKTKLKSNRKMTKS